jgi:hypothetical protein
MNNRFEMDGMSGLRQQRLHDLEKVRARHLLGGEIGSNFLDGSTKGGEAQVFWGEEI